MDIIHITILEFYLCRNTVRWEKNANQEEGLNCPSVCQYVICLCCLHQHMKYPVMIAPTHVPELLTVEHTEQGIRFGAAVTLSQIDNELKSAMEKYPGQSPLPVSQ
ncbi:hypothetical protein DPMN_101845 [Dreissena polymorpha]|uniref:Molybdopterin dehydrogenase FAD-binding domain-containing protein n=1 Tax=Dreissena polymorpha TaxID=45954 RepID=A0A9D4LJR7_DREPO|nr:hypothetical protein DPMN_101845 [Dreissena polymorpha]